MSDPSTNSAPQDSDQRRWRALWRQADGFITGPLVPENETNSEQRRGRRLLWFDGLVSNISESFITSYVNPFAMALGATNAQIGLLTAISNLGAALGLAPGARLDERLRNRKPLILITGGGIGRLLLIALGLSPFFLRSEAAIYVFIALISLRAFFGQLAYPAWSALVADLVPKAVRGRYFASRNIGLAVAALIFTPLAGRIVDLIGLPRGYQITFVAAGLVGFIATAIFGRIPEPPRASPAAAAGGERLSLATLARHPRFLALTSVAFIWNLSLMVAGPFFSVLLVRHLDAIPTQIGILAAVNSVMGIIGQRLWGRLNDRKGAVWVMRLTGLLIPLVPLGWSVVPSVWYLLLVEASAGFLWAGYGLAGFNLLLSLAPEAQRSRFVALYQVAVFVSSFVGPLLGGLWVSAFPIRTIFALSAAGRMAAALVFLFTVRGDREPAG